MQYRPDFIVFDLQPFIELFVNIFQAGGEVAVSIDGIDNDAPNVLVGFGATLALAQESQTRVPWAKQTSAVESANG